MTALLELTSHIDGKNAKVRVHTDRIEWERPKSVSGGKMAAAIMTVGMSAAVTGGVKSRKGSGTEVIFMQSVTSVTTRRDTVLNDIVSVIASGNTIDFRVSKKEARELKNLILSLVSGSHPSQQQAPPPAPAPVYAPPVAPQAVYPPQEAQQPAEEDPAAKIAQLAQMYRVGLITAEEYSAAKAKALGL